MQQALANQKISVDASRKMVVTFNRLVDARYDAIK